MFYWYINNMNKINQFFDKAPLWQIYIFGWFASGTIVAAMFYFLQMIDAASPELVITGDKCIKIGATSGLLFGLMFMLMNSIMRKSQAFWDYTKEVEKLIDEAQTKDQLQSILENEFQELRSKCQGGPQIPELNRLFTIMKTKAKYIPIN